MFQIIVRRDELQQRVRWETGPTTSFEKSGTSDRRAVFVTDSDRKLLGAFLGPAWNEEAGRKQQLPESESGPNIGKICHEACAEQRHKVILNV